SCRCGRSAWAACSSPPLLGFRAGLLFVRAPVALRRTIAAARRTTQCLEQMLQRELEAWGYGLHTNTTAFAIQRALILPRDRPRSIPHPQYGPPDVRQPG